MFLDCANYAQRASAGLAETDWARRHLVRTASVNQVSGTARWRIAGDTIVMRQAELPSDVVLSTSDEEQNQGRYYLRARRLALVLTIRRKPHKEQEQPKALQLQIEEVLEQAPIDFGEEVVVYLAVPPLGQQPSFEIASKGKETISHRLIDLIGGEPGKESGPGATITPLDPKRPRGGPTVRSTIAADERSDQEGD